MRFDGIGAAAPRRPLPHHRAYGSARPEIVVLNPTPSGPESRAVPPENRPVPQKVYRRPVMRRQEPAERSRHICGTSFESSMLRRAMTTNIVMIVLRVLFVIMAFLATGMRGAFGRSGPTRPLTLTGRAILLATGVLLVGTGIHRLLK